MKAEIELLERSLDFFRGLRRNHKIDPEVAALAAVKEVECLTELRKFEDEAQPVNLSSPEVAG